MAGQCRMFARDTAQQQRRQQQQRDIQRQEEEGNDEKTFHARLKKGQDILLSLFPSLNITSRRVRW